MVNGTPEVPLSATTHEAKAPREAVLRVVPILLVLSGATALAAQVVLGRLLTYVFGASHLSTSTVLAAYMAGLAGGTYAVGRLTVRLRRPLRFYGILEFLVGLCLAALPSLFVWFRELSIQLTQPWARDPIVLTAIRFGLSFVLVLLPTFLMGGTLPTLISAFRGAMALKQRLPILYAANTLGAGMGAFVCGYFLIRYLGLDGTLYLCGIINVGVGLCGIWLSSRVHEGQETATPADAQSEEDAPSGEPGLRGGQVCALAFVQGILTFMLEVVWFHLLGTVIGVTTYAFSVMLTVILLGMGVGSAIAPRLQRRLGSSAAVFVAAQLLMAAGVAASLFVWDRFPNVINLSLAMKETWSFWGRETVRFAFTLIVLVPSTLAMGAALPALTAAVRAQEESVAERRPGAWVGAVFGANTLGTILGALGCGFLLLGRVPSDIILRAAAIISLALALAAHAATHPRSLPGLLGKKTIILSSSAVLLAVILFPGWNRLRLTAGTHYYWQLHDEKADKSRRLLFFQEDAQNGFVSVVKSEDGLLSMLTNGKYEGSNLENEFQDLLALLGGLYLRRFDSAVLIGLGPGRTLQSLHAMPFKRIEALEFSPAIIDAAKSQFQMLSGRSLSDKDRVELICEDGRNYLQLSKGPYDFITISVTGAAFAGVGNLYSRDFLDLIRQRLTKEGVVLLWIQVHHVLAQDVRSVVHTVRSVFPHVHFYAEPTGRQGFVIASASPLRIDPVLTAELSRRPGVRHILQRNGYQNLVDLVRLSIFTTEEELQAYFSWTEIPGKPRIFTDMDPALEYSTPYGLATTIVAFNFQPFSACRLPVFEPPLAEADEEGLKALRFLMAQRTDQARECLKKAVGKGGHRRWQRMLEMLEKKRGN